VSGCWLSFLAFCSSAVVKRYSKYPRGSYEESIGGETKRGLLVGVSNQEKLDRLADKVGWVGVPVSGAGMQQVLNHRSSWYSVGTLLSLLQDCVGGAYAAMH
jgi:hypothetical protein